MPYVSPRPMALSFGNDTETAKLASHCAAAASARALALMRLLNISPSITQTTGPQLTPKKTTYRLAATNATMPRFPGRVGLPATTCACWKQKAIVARVSKSPEEPTTRSGLPVSYTHLRAHETG